MNVIVRKTWISRLIPNKGVFLNGIKLGYGQKSIIANTDNIEVKTRDPFLFRVNTQRIYTPNADSIELTQSINIQKFILKNLISILVVFVLYYGVLKFYQSLSMPIGILVLISSIYSNFISSILWKTKVNE